MKVGFEILQKPNFFILGAPKCGTTSLAAWLGGHPHIFMSSFKEPHFFNTDDRRGVQCLEDYERLFQSAGGGHLAIGEASVWYLSSSCAVENILRYQPEARFIVMLRNPIEMAPALHAEMLLSGHENIRSFRTAWDLQAARRGGEHLPPLTWATRRLLYGEICSLGAQLQKLYSTVSSERVLTIFLDDVAAGPRGEYLRALDFLRVADDGRQAFPVLNKARTSRWPRLTRAAFVAAQIKRRLGMELGLNLWERLAVINRFEESRPMLDPETVAVLGAFFAPDIERLGALLGRDLCGWLSGKPALAPDFPRMLITA